MMERKTVSEKSAFYSALMQLITQGNFIALYLFFTLLKYVSQP
jgi:hypothetical protein